MDSTRREDEMPEEREEMPTRPPDRERVRGAEPEQKEPDKFDPTSQGDEAGEVQ